MVEFRSFKALENYLKKAISNALEDEPAKVVKNLMQENILIYVYNAYQMPILYERRGEFGGLADEDNIIVKKQNENRVEIFNITKRNKNFTSQYLAPVIEFGHEKAVSKGYRGYSFPYPTLAYYYPRPFIKHTRRDLRITKAHVEAFKKSLKKYGIDSE